MTGIGVLIPTREYHLRGETDARRLVDFAVRAEDLGFDSVWAGDSLHARPRVEPLTLLAAVAGATRDVTIGTAALTAALRHPVLAAHSVATLDQVSGGRLIVGLGAGFPYPSTEAEFAVAGVPFADRIARMMETVAVWRLLLRADTAVDVTAALEKRGLPDDLDALPKPVQPGGPPLWLAGGGPTALRRAARHFDGWLPYPPTAAEYRHGLKAIEHHARESGRPASAVTAGLYVTVNSSGPRSARQQLDDYCLGYYGFGIETMEHVQAFYGGDLDGCVAWLASYVEAGARHVILRFGAGDPDGHLDWAGKHLLSALRQHLPVTI